MTREQRGRRYRIREAIVIGVALLLVIPATAAEAQQAASVSTEQLYVRRGPGAEFPPFATLGRGDRVEVHEVRGEWARIVTGNGQTGYVRSDFLSLRDKEKTTPEVAVTPTPSDVGTPATRPTKSPKPTRTATPTRKPKATKTPTLPQPTATPKLTATRWVAAAVTPPPTSTPRWVQSATAPPATATGTGTPELPSATVAQAAPALAVVATPDTALLEKLRVEVARLTLAVEELRRRMDSQPSLEGPLPVGDGSSQSSPSGWPMVFAFGIIGALVGWILGASVGRRQERSQRSRIRF